MLVLDSGLVRHSDNYKIQGKGFEI